MKYFLLALCFMLPASGSWAEDAHPPASGPTPVAATLENLIKAAARVDAIDLSDDHVIDDYARIVHCNIYQRYYQDEFTWRDVRKAMRQSIALNKNSFPLSFYLYRTETFGLYDFNTHTLPLTGNSIMRRTEYLELRHVDRDDLKICDAKLETIPPTFVAVLDKAVQMQAIPIAERQAALVVRYFDTSPTGRMGYGRYQVTVFNGGPNNQHGEHRLDFGAHLDNIDFFLDPGLQKIFWTGLDTPIITKAPERLNSLNGIPFKGINGADGTQAPATETPAGQAPAATQP